MQCGLSKHVFFPNLPRQIINTGPSCLFSPPFSGSHLIHLNSNRSSIPVCIQFLYDYPAQRCTHCIRTVSSMCHYKQKRADHASIPKNTFMHNNSFYITLIKSFPRLTAHLSAFAKIKQPPPDFYTNLCPQLEQNFAPFCR